MNSDILFAVGIFLASQICILSSGFVIFAMIGEINRKVADNERISYFRGHFGKTVKIFREYRRLYPGGKMHIAALGLFSLGMVFLLTFAWQFGLFM